MPVKLYLQSRAPRRSSSAPRTFGALLLLSVALAACPAPGPETEATPAGGRRITSAQQLVEAMRERYDGRWYRTLTFVQRNTLHLPGGGEQASTWLEAISLPGKLRIDIEPRSHGSGVLFVNDTQFVIRGDTVARVIPGAHPLLLLGFDVYFHPVSRTMADLRTLGFDVSKLRTDTWQGRPAYVVGADSGDLHSRQFWVDRERLVFVRMIQPAVQDTARTSETRFNAYRPLGEGWIAPEVEFLTDGRLVFVERYEDITVDPPLDPALFDPARWRTAPHWYRAP